MEVELPRAREREIPLAAAALRRNFGGVNPALPRRRFLRNSAALATAALAAPRLSPLLHAGEAAPAFRSRWERSPDRPWTGPEFWANPMQDWRVAEGRADAGFGIRAEAAARGLTFLPLFRERFDLVMERRHFFTDPVQNLLAFTRTEVFATRAARLGGYDLAALGSVAFNA